MDPFTTIHGRNWMAERVLKNVAPPLNMLLLFGNGPFEADELAKFLTIHNIKITLNERSFAAGEVEEQEGYEQWVRSDSAERPIVVIGREGFHSPGLVSLVLPSTVRDIAIPQVEGTRSLPFALERMTVHEWKAHIPVRETAGSILSRKEFGERFNLSEAELKRRHSD